MRKEFLANAIANIGDNYVEEFVRVKKRKTIRNIFGSIGAAGIAAALVLVIGLNAKDPYSGLPKIDLADYHTVAMGGNTGHTGLISKDEEPPIWESMKLKTLPVYTSESTEPDHEKMLNYIKNKAAALGISESGLEIRDNYDSIKESEERNSALFTPTERQPSFEPIRCMMWQQYYISAKGNGIEIDLRSNYDLFVSFEQPIELPGEFDFSENASKEEHSRALGYLAERFKALTGYDDYTEEGKYLHIYKAADTDELNIVNRYLDLTCFDVVNGKLVAILIHSSDGCNKLEDYPIITAGEAEKLLKADTVKEELRMPGDAEILRIELRYENLTGYTAIIPYYDFYVRSDETDLSDDTIVCDFYRISAVPSSFFEDTETGDYGTGVGGAVKIAG